ncbi:MAG: hypothetical protein ATN36_06575 [Epulopiscium sp. Nele67-Bin005]|nr:MAG: hypothetical protein ATN36_06575 [Epulopiscium sp. Nele67-Bin005]
MGRIESLSILANGGGNDLLSQKYGAVIESYVPNFLSSRLKNQSLSGDPSTGSVEAKRFMNIQSQEYGTARTANSGQKTKAESVNIQININKELVEEIEEKDTRLYGVDGLIDRRINEHMLSYETELETTFLETLYNDATEFASTGDIAKDIDNLIVKLSSVRNDFVRGVPKNMMEIVCSPEKYAELRQYLDTLTTRPNIDTAVEEIAKYHGVRVSESIFLPEGAGSVITALGSVAMPVINSVMDTAKVQQSDAYTFGLFYYYGVGTVTPDLIFKVA